MINKYIEESKEVSMLNVLVRNPFNEIKLTLAVISLFPMLFVTKTIEAAISYGILVLILLLVTSLIASIFKKLIDKDIKLLFMIISIVGLVSIFKIFVDAFIPNLTEDFAIYIYLLGVSPVLFINYNQASYKTVKKGLMEALGTGLGIIITLIVVAFFRETLSTGSLTFGRYLPIAKNAIDLGFAKYAMTNMKEPYGALIIFGLLLASFLAIKQKGVETKWWIY